MNGFEDGSLVEDINPNGTLGGKIWPCMCAGWGYWCDGIADLVTGANHNMKVGVMYLLLKCG